MCQSLMNFPTGLTEHIDSFLKRWHDRKEAKTKALQSSKSSNLDEEEDPPPPMHEGEININDKHTHTHTHINTHT